MSVGLGENGCTQIYVNALLFNSTIWIEYCKLRSDNTATILDGILHDEIKQGLSRINNNK